MLPPFTLIKYEPFHAKVLFKTPKYNVYLNENFRVFDKK